VRQGVATTVRWFREATDSTKGAPER